MIEDANINNSQKLGSSCCCSCADISSDILHVSRHGREGFVLTSGYPADSEHRLHTWPFSRRPQIHRGRGVTSLYLHPLNPGSSPHLDKQALLPGRGGPNVEVLHTYNVPWDRFVPDGFTTRWLCVYIWDLSPSPVLVMDCLRPTAVRGTTRTSAVLLDLT